MNELLTAVYPGKGLRFWLQSFSAALTLVLVFVGIGAADQVELKNGDRLTGEVRGLEDQTLLFRSAALGEIRIPLEHVARLESKKPVWLILESGEELKGTLEEFKAGIWVIRSPESVEALRIPNARVTELNVGTAPPRKWRGKISAGLAAQSGNTDSFGYNFLGELRFRARSHSLTFEGTYERKEEEGDIITDKGGISGRYDYLFTDRHFLFDVASLEKDRAEELDYRVTESLGAGYFFIRTKRTELSGEIGPSLIHERFRDGERETDLAGRVAAVWEQKLWKSTLSAKAAYLPKLGDPKREFLANGQLTFSTPIMGSLFWEFIVRDEYDNDPQPGVKRNDVSVITNLALRF